MIKKLSILFLLTLSTVTLKSQNTTIPEADPFCSDTGILFDNTSDGSPSELGPDYGCLGSQPNPSWFYIKIDEPGVLTLLIEQNTQANFNGAGLDVDFIAWGPFTENRLQDIQSGNYGLLSAFNEIDCSYEPDFIEELNINNAQNGEYYLILITNFSGSNGFIRMNETNPGGLGVGTTDCSIVAGELGPDQEVCEGTIVTLDGTSPSDNPTYKWFIDTGSGFTEIVGETNPMLTINNNQSGIYKVEVTDDLGNSDDDEVEINFYSQPTITPLPNPLYEVFDTDGTEDGYTTFNLRDLFNNILLGSGQAPGTYGVEYYQSQADADANVSPIPNSGNYTNIPDNPDFTDDIFARVVTNAAPNTCIPATTSFKLLVNINEPPVLSADFRGAYCPLSDIKIAENFTITDSDDTGLDFFTVQISEGYSNPTDLLELTGTHPTITARPFDITEGKLILEPTAPATEIAYADLQLAVRDIIFTSTDPNISGERSFSFTIGDANYLPATEHFYVYEENIGITWSDAKNLAESSTYFGLRGYLATILSEEESIISAEQISGTGWIGASDEGTEGEWKWVTGPEVGTTFWNGNASGSAAINPTTGLPYYSNWNTNPAEPNNVGNEDYAHITDNTIGIPGSWNDLTNTGAPNGPYQPKGYIVEYGGTPGDPVLNISTSTSIFIPQITNFDPVKRNCTGGTMTFTASASEGEIYWYDAPTGGNLIEIGDTFTTPSLTGSKKYYVSASPEGCASTERIAVDAIIDATPVVITAPSDINRCDEDRVGFLDFDLQVDQTPIILAGLDPILNPVLTDFEVLYFDNLPDAEANTTANIIANPYRVNTSNNPTIYARIHNSNNTTCFTTVEFKLKVTDTPVLTQPTVYRLCDDTASGSDTDEKSSFLLNTKDAEILTDVTNPGEYTISYHTDILDAQTSSTTNAIDKDADYQITTSQRVYVRIENNNDPTLCYTVSDDSASSTFKSFELIVDPLPVVNTGVEINYCIVTGDPNPTVDLTQAENQISSTTNASFEYFKDLAGTDLILDPVSYPPVGNVLQSVYVKVISDQGCARDLVELVLNIGETPNNSFDDLVAIECDDFLDQDGNDTPAMNDDTDNITNFSLDLTAIIAAINPPINTEVFFYESTSDRNSNSNNIPDLTNYRNNPTNIDITVVPDGIRFPIYYKILSTINNDCEGIGQFYLQINQVPTVNPYGDLILCDDGDDGDFVNGIVQTFDLESQTPIILGTQDPLNFTVSYHLTDLDALSGASPIMNTSMYENITPNLQTIYVRVTNNTTGCFTNHTSFDLIVNPLPIANFVDDLEVCDDNTDGSAQNGFSQSFDLELQTAGILGTQDPTQFSVTYHASLADAQAGTLPLGSPFSNSVPFSQIIYARVYNSLTGCANGISNFNAIVNPEPTTENASNVSYCDDDSDGDDTNGFVQNIDLDSQITDILGPLQDPDDFNVTFHETQTDATDGTDALSSPYTNTTANQQTIYVRVENKDTGCVNDDFTFDVIVNPLPKFTVTSPQIVCLSGPPLTLFIENPDAVYDYVWTAPNGEESFGEEITITSGGLYTVTATTTNGTGCTRTREIQVNESIVATITEADVTIVDDSDNNSITIDPTNLGIGDYQYALINENGLQTAFQDIPVFENLSGGFYTIVVQDKNGCGPDANLIVSVIEYPKFFTPNNDGINDTWAIKGANSTFYPSAQINIFNRFGKIVAQIDVDNPGWDGTYGGKRLPSDDYWFSIMLIDRNGNARERKGNFSMLRR